MKKISKYFAIVILTLLITSLLGCNREQTEIKKADTVQEKIEVSHKEENETAVQATEQDEKESQAEDEEKLVCDLLVEYSDIFNDIACLKKEKQHLISEGGIILSLSGVEFKDGESVFDVLKREIEKAGKSLEYSKMPVYGNIYIEGIDNICEFDCGNSSGWLYTVNGDHPMVSSSQYKLKSGDKIHFIYKREAY